MVFRPTSQPCITLITNGGNQNDQKVEYLFCYINDCHVTVNLWLYFEVTLADVWVIYILSQNGIYRLDNNSFSTSRNSHNKNCLWLTILSFFSHIQVTVLVQCYSPFIYSPKPYNCNLKKYKFKLLQKNNPNTTFKYFS